ncbi:MAG: T9SS type A sorting domain-containing protein [Bacteroidota bacterium]
MKKTLIKIFGIALAIFLTADMLLAQEEKSQITLDITKEINGEKETFKKTYDSQAEMAADVDLQTFTNDANGKQIRYAVVGPGNKTMKINQTDSSMEYVFDFDTQVSKVVKKMKGLDDMDDDSLSIVLNDKIRKLEDALAHLGMNVKEEIEIMEDMDWDEIKERHKIMIIDKDEHNKSITKEDNKKSITISSLDGNEFGKRGKVSHNELLNLEVLDYYPNPSPGQFRLKFQVSEPGPLNIKIFNKDQQEVYVRYFPRYSGVFSELIDLRGQDEGTYLLEISQDKKRLVRKMVIK